MKKTCLIFSLLMIHCSGLMSVTHYHSRSSWTPLQSEEWMNQQSEFVNVQIPTMILKKYPELALEKCGRYLTNIFLALEGYAFVSKEALYPEEARSFLIQIHQEILEEINKSKDAIFYLTENPKATSITKEQIAIKISYRSMINDFMMPPYVAQVSINKGKLFYNFNNPQTGHLNKSIAFNN